MSVKDAADECRDKVLRWLKDLQSARKCSFTNAVCKAVGKLETVLQNEIVVLISQEILKLTQKKDIESVRKACNVINGCFDNFPYAVQAINLIFDEILIALTYYLDLCSQFFSGVEILNLNKIEAVDLTHAISRIGSLVLKVRRWDRISQPNFVINKKFWAAFPRLSLTCTQLICHEERIGIDTKINLAMVLWLLREVNSPSLENLIKLQQEFADSLPVAVEVDAYNANIVNFIMAGGAINLWGENIIAPNDTAKYLTLFVSLCESYSSDTTVLLMACRSLQVLGKHKSFITYEMTNEEASRLIACNLMLLEHPVACARHSGRDLLQVLICIPKLLPIIKSAVLAVCPDRKSFYIGLALLAQVMDTRDIIKIDKEIPSSLMTAISDPTSVSHVSFAIECLALHDSLIHEDSQNWCMEWVLPLLQTLSQAVPIVAAEIEKLLLKLFKERPLAIEYVLKKWSSPSCDEELRGTLICLKIRYKLKGDKEKGVKLAHLSSSVCDSSTSSSTVPTEESSSVPSPPRTDHISVPDVGVENVLKLCMSHGEDDIRVSAFSLIAESSLLTKTDLDNVLHFIKYNLNNHRPATRQKVIAFFKKLLTRVNISYLSLQKPSKNQAAQVTDEIYVEFLIVLIKFCYENIFVGGNFNRLNTVLSVLNLCRDILDPTLAVRCRLHQAKYWPNLLTALSSSYEENKVLAVQLAKELPFGEMDINEPGTLRQELRTAFGLIQELEPPSVLLGSYLICVLLCAPSAGTVLKQYFCDCIEAPSVRPDVLCIQVLSRYLLLQLDEARISTITAARQAPMYGTMFAIRLLLKQLDRETLKLDETKLILRQLIETSFNIADAVSSVVNNSSPEGHLPMDFQRLIEEKGYDSSEREVNKSEKNSGDLESMMSAYKIAGTAEEKMELAGCIRNCLETELEQKMTHDSQGSLFDPDITQWRKSIIETKRLFAEYDCYFKFFEGHLPRIIEERPVTAQAVLLYSWRSMKEACLYLGDIVSKLPLKEALAQDLLNEDILVQIGLKLRVLLSEMKHRGAFEQADVAFSQLCHALWMCPVLSLQTLPGRWLDEVLKEILLPPEDQTLKFTSTRRSAGLPFLVQAIIATEVSSNFSNNAERLQQTMKTLLCVAEDVKIDLEPRLHALNILRSLFKHAQLGEFVVLYVSRALEVAIRGSRSPTWPERNCSNLLFSSLIVRVFGVARSRDHLSKKNKMTSKVFFQRFPSLYNLFNEELARVELLDDDSGKMPGVKPQPSLYLVLLLMGRLYPPSQQDVATVDLAPFVRQMALCAGNPIQRIRVLAARALVPFLPPDRIPSELSWRLNELQRQHGVSNNLRHGLLLQIIELLDELRKHPKLMDAFLVMPLPLWLFPGTEYSSKYLETTSLIPVPVLHAVVQLLTVVCRYYPNHNDNPREVLMKPIDWSLLTYWATQRRPGADAFLAALLSLKLEVATNLGPVDAKPIIKWFEKLFYLKDCGLEVVENVVLQFIYCVLTPDSERDKEFDFSLTEGMVEEMICFSSEEKRVQLKKMLVSLWLNYSSSERIALTRTRNLQQRRLRLLTLGSVIADSVRAKGTENPREIFQLMLMYASYWEPDGVYHNLDDCFDSVCLTESTFGRLVSVLDALINSDKPCRMVAAAVFDYAWWSLVPSSSQTLGYEFGRYWLRLFQLLANEDEEVRRAALYAVHSLARNWKNRPIDLPLEVVTPLAAQEILLLFYAHFMGDRNASCVNFLFMALLTIIDTAVDSPDDPLEIFKRGNPNPFNENIALTRLFAEAALKNFTVGVLDRDFPGDDSSILLHIELSPHFARYGLRLKPFKTPMELLQELLRLGNPDNACNDVFWCQVQELLKIVGQKT